MSKFEEICEIAFPARVVILESALEFLHQCLAPPSEIKLPDEFLNSCEEQFEDWNLNKNNENLIKLRDALLAKALS